jgi:flavin reductase (DIM6/NTAB) family NADH-FMN oxidoreductase RutF
MHVPIPLNGTIFLIGEIIEAIIPESYVQEDGYVDLQKAGTLTVAGLDAYFSTELIDRYTYARPGVLPHSLANRREQSS